MVRCTDASGALADSAFTILALKPPAAERRFSFAWADRPTEASYAPASQYAFAPEAAGGVLITRAGVGRYSVRLGARTHHVQVSAYGADGAYCSVMGWSTVAANVACFSPTGAPADARFTVLAVNPAVAPFFVFDPTDRITPGRPIIFPSPREVLFGYFDLHTHPASFLGFGGRQDGRQGMMWGRPAVDGDGALSGFRSLSAADRFGQCFPEDHSAKESDIIQKELRKLIMESADARTHAPHSNRGPARSDDWPNSLMLSHQQIDVEWLRRAYQGGLRAIVAAAVDNEVVDTAYDKTFGNLLPLVDAFLDGRPIRPFLGMPRPEFGFETARQQLAFIRQLVEQNSDFMEIALTSSDARRIIAERGKMAVILGLELDTLSPVQIRQLVEEDDVRLVTPIHFVDNEIGGAAAYETIFALLNGVVGVNGRPYALVDDENLDFHLGREFRRRAGRDRSTDGLHARLGPFRGSLSLVCFVLENI